jgi:hypothetical protein
MASRKKYLVIGTIDETRKLLWTATSQKEAQYAVQAAVKTCPEYDYVSIVVA